MLIHIKVQNQVSKAHEFVDSLTLDSAIEIYTRRASKNSLKTNCAATGIRSKMSTVEGVFGCLISLPILLLCAIIAIAIIAEQFG